MLRWGSATAKLSKKVASRANYNNLNCVRRAGAFMNMSLLRSVRLPAFTVALTLAVACLTACGGGSSNVPSGSGDAPTATLTASPSSITAGQSATLTWSTTNATSAQIDNGVGSVTVPSGTATVAPTQTTTYTITAMGSNNQQATAQATVTVNAATPSDIKHVVFMLQENRSFDTYFGMLNPYRAANELQRGRGRRHLHGRRHRRQAVTLHQRR